MEIPLNSSFEEKFETLESFIEGNEDEFVNKFKELFNLNEQNEFEQYIPLFRTMFFLTNKESWFHARNGAIDKKEFADLVRTFPLDYDSMIGTNNKNNIKKLIIKILFNLVDVNHNEKISKSEFAIFAECYKMERQHIDQIFDYVDTDKNGEISEAEFSSWINSF